MKITAVDKFLAFLTLFSGLAISAVAIYYSVAGLVSIFAAAVIPIIVMGVVLEIGKLVATLWLKQNWNIAPRFIKGYLLSAVVILMFITSMGTFGYLSKAHLDQGVPTGDIADKVALIDEKIKTQKDNIDVARKALVQMDASVDQTMARSTNEQGATRAAQLRKSQAKERASLQAEIATAQKEIAKLNDERAPVAKELRKVEAEVGPIKYIAALIYGNTLDQNLLENAVRWVIILIVIIFDPLAVVLLLASQYSFQYFRSKQAEGDSLTTESMEVINSHPTVALSEESLEDINMQLTEAANDAKVSDYDINLPDEPVEFKVTPETHPYLFQEKSFWAKPEGYESVKPLVYIPEESAEITVDTSDVTVDEHNEEPIERPGDYLIQEEMSEDPIHAEDAIKKIESGYHELQKKEHTYMIKENDKQVVMTTK